MTSPSPAKSRTFPIRAVLVVPFVLQIFATVGLVGYLSFRNGQRAVNTLAEELIDRTSELVDEHLHAYLSIPQNLNQLNADAIRRGVLDVSDRPIALSYFWDQMQIYNLTYVGIGLANGEGFGVARYDGETITMDEWTADLPNNNVNYTTDDQGNRVDIYQLNDWDSLNEPWYADPIEAGKPIWADIVAVNVGAYHYITASASRPIYDTQNQLLGMIAADIHLLKLNDFLKRLGVSENGTVFILERDGTLIASSSQQPFVITEGEIQRLSITDSGDSTIRAIAQQFQQQGDGLQAVRTQQQLNIEIEGMPHFVKAFPWSDEYGLDWVVAVAIPEREFMAQINTNTRHTIALCLGALGAATVLGVFTARWITRPILQLTQASEAMAEGNLNHNLVLQDSTVRELNTLSASFRHMATQLQDAFTELEIRKADLEDRVQERTATLQATLEELQRTQGRMVQSEKMSSLGQLVAGVAHEINNPVNFIHGNLSHVQTYTDDLLTMVQLYQHHYPHPVKEIQTEADAVDLEFIQEDLPKILSSIQIGTNRIREIVLSLRTFSRMDEADLKPVDIHAGIDSTLMILQHRLKARADRPEIEVIKDYNTLPQVECYAGQLNQVFMNILVNAIDALEDDNAGKSYSEIQANPNQITIRTDVIDQQWAQIAIADNGIGIPPAIQERIFNPFFTTKPVGKGTGMGMSISYQIVTEKHGGALKCLSTPGQGTEFVIQIPLRPNASNQSQQSS